MKPLVDQQGQEEQSKPNYSDFASSRFNPNELPPSLQQFIDAHRNNLPSFGNPPNFPSHHSSQPPPFYPPPYPPQLPPLPPPPSSYYSHSMKGGFNLRSATAFSSSSARSNEGGMQVGAGGPRSLTPDLLQLRDAPPPSIIGIPSAQRRTNERRWQQLNDDRYFALAGATAVTHCYSGYTQLDNEKELQKNFNRDVDELFKRFEPPDFISKEQKQQLQAVLQNLEITWNASYVNMTKLHESSNRFMAFNINVGPPASPLPSLLQHKFRALAHAALKILALPIRPSRDHLHIKNHPSRGLMNPLSHSKDLDFWREVARRFPGDHRTVLKGWLLMNFAHPYPNEHDKSIMAQITGMTRVQIGNWFINQRVRWWRPLVEELASELQQEVYFGNFPPLPPHPPIPGQPPPLPPPGLDIMSPPGGLPPPPPHVLQQLQKQFPPEFFQNHGKDLPPGSNQNMFSFLQSQNNLFGSSLKHKDNTAEVSDKGDVSPQGESAELPPPLNGSKQSNKLQNMKINSCKDVKDMEMQEEKLSIQSEKQQISSNSCKQTGVLDVQRQPKILGQVQQQQVQDLGQGQVQGSQYSQEQWQGQGQGQGQVQSDFCQGNATEQLHPPSPQIQNSEVQNCQVLNQNQCQGQGQGQTNMLNFTHEQSEQEKSEAEDQNLECVGVQMSSHLQEVGIMQSFPLDTGVVFTPTLTPTISPAPMYSPQVFQDGEQSPSYSIPSTVVRAGLQKSTVNSVDQTQILDETNGDDQHEIASEPQVWDPLDRIRGKKLCYGTQTNQI